MEETSYLHEPSNCQIDCKVFSPMQSHYAELAPFMASPYASDFGNSNVELNFQGGTSEQEFDFTELLDEFFNNHDEVCCEDSSIQKDLLLESELQSSGQQLLSPANFFAKDNSICNHTDTEMSPVQVDK